jgi:crotonobetainyl-CoA:carnitine CoA-transferase CaiB-like acyl-CoA transferase
MTKSYDLPWYEWVQEHTAPEEAAKKPEALSDLLVLDLSYGNMGGLVCSSMLAEQGATVVRIEPPSGDQARKFSPSGIMHQDTGLGYMAEGRNKHHVTLNLESPPAEICS